MKKIVTAYLVFATGIAVTCLALVPFLVGRFPSLFPLTMAEHLPYILTLLLWSAGLRMGDGNNLVPLIMAVVFHPSLYLLLNVYVLRRAFRRIALRSARAFLPSQIVVLILTVLSIWWGLSQWRAGLYGGDSYDLIRSGMLNATVIFLLLLAPREIVQRLSIRGDQLSNTFVLGYNFCIYVAFVLVLFPWMGEAFL
jgi:hypothetical protein